MYYFLDSDKYIIFALALESSQVVKKLLKLYPHIKPDSSYYRPILKLLQMNKILEKFINNQLYKFLIKNCFLSDNQYEFRKTLPLILLYGVILLSVILIIIYILVKFLRFVKSL